MAPKKTGIAWKAALSMDMPVEITLSVAGHRIMTTPIWFSLIFWAVEISINSITTSSEVHPRNPRRPDFVRPRAVGSAAFGDSHQAARVTPENAERMLLEK